MNRIISPSLLSADFSKLHDQIKTVESAGANRLHLDVMDGNFVPNLTFGPIIVKAIRKLSKSHLESHLMICSPERYLDDYIEAGSDTVIIHEEASKDLKQDLMHIRGAGVQAGVSLKPKTDPEKLTPFLDYIDYILVMSVEPGFGGQKFIPASLEKMRTLVKMRQNRPILIAVDGGVNLMTIGSIYNAGADITIVGSALYNAANIQKRFQDLLNVG